MIDRPSTFDFARVYVVLLLFWVASKMVGYFVVLSLITNVTVYNLWLSNCTDDVIKSQQHYTYRLQCVCTDNINTVCTHKQQCVCKDNIKNYVYRQTAVFT